MDWADILSKMNQAVDELLAKGWTKEKIIEDCRIWLDNWEECEDD